MSLSQDHWRSQYERNSALYISDHNPLRPHFVLSDGDHSDCFFNSERVMQDPLLMDEAAYSLALGLQDAGLVLDDVSRVVGPAMGAITQAHDIARQIGRLRGKTCLRAYVEKTSDEPGAPMKFGRTQIERGERIVLAEDVLTTGASAERAADIVIKSGGVLLPYLAVLVNRSGLEYVGSMRIVALITADVSKWKPDECPLCKAGSEPIKKAKDPANWARITADY